MLQFMSFGSGSSGNCYYLANENDAILIDAGIGVRKVKHLMREYGLSASKLRAILITHDHADHVKASGNLSSDFTLPVYATEKVHEGIQHSYRFYRKIEPMYVKFIPKDEEFSIFSLRITAFELPHDSAENVGYSIHTDNPEDGVFTIMTDIGTPTEKVYEYIEKSNFLVLESNYDEEMLASGTYPKMLQDRIKGGHGHLSNHQSAEALAKCFHEHLKNVWLCHLSEENNHPELARKTVECHLRSFGIIAGKDFQLEVLKRHVASDLYELSIKS